MPENCECPTEAGSATCELRQRSEPRLCPTCGERGKAVDTGTLKALLAVSLTEVGQATYFFCRTSTCPTVYFTGTGDQRFTEANLREQVHQKHPEDDDVFVCYCFRHTPAAIKADVIQTGRSDVIGAITAAIQAGKCACDIRNPQGSCCLGNVRAVVQRLAGAVARLE